MTVTARAYPPLGAIDVAPSQNGGRASARSPEQVLQLVRLHAATLDDLERSRKALGNRVGAALRSSGIPKGQAKRIVQAVQQFGSEALTGEDMLALTTFGLNDVFASFHATVELEERVETMLIRSWRQHPMAPWAKSVSGVGEKSIARLVSEIGDPLVRVIGEWQGEGEARSWVETGREPRTFAQLCAYVGHGDARRRKRQGMSQDEAFRLGNPAAKMRVYLIAEAGMKGACRTCRLASRQRKEEGEVAYAPPPAGCTCAETHPLRHAYNVARAKYATRLHTEEDAPRTLNPGDPWAAAHQHAAAMRFVGKAFLKLLWKEANKGGSTCP